MTFITLMKFTDQGIRNVKDTVERAKSFIEAGESKFGVKIKEIYWTLGEYDLVSITDAPDEETATALALSLGTLGNVRTLGMRAFNAEEMSGILAKIS